MRVATTLFLSVAVANNLQMEVRPSGSMRMLAKKPNVLAENAVSLVEMQATTHAALAGDRGILDSFLQNIVSHFDLFRTTAHSSVPTEESMALAEELKKVIGTVLEPAIVAAHKEDATDLAAAFKEIHLCDEAKRQEDKVCHDQKAWATRIGDNYNTCHLKLATTQKMDRNCDSKVSNLQKAKERNCLDFEQHNSVVQANFSKCFADCDVNSQTPEECYRAALDTVTELESFLMVKQTEYNRKKASCEEYTAQLQRAEQQCNTADRDVAQLEVECASTRRQECDAQMEWWDCVRNRACTKYLGCREAEDWNYGFAERRAEARVENLREYWTIVEHIECVVDNYQKDKALVPEKYTTCREGPHMDTSHLELEKRALPERLPCEKDEMPPYCQH